MTHVARYAKLVAHGAGAASLPSACSPPPRSRTTPGCELYLINRQTGRPEAVWVTELWRSQDDLDAAIEKVRRSGKAMTSPR